MLILLSFTLCHGDSLLKIISFITVVTLTMIWIAVIPKQEWADITS